MRSSDPQDADLCGHVLAEDVRANEPLPPFPASVKDGYAVIGAFPRNEIEIHMCTSTRPLNILKIKTWWFGKFCGRDGISDGSRQRLNHQAITRNEREGDVLYSSLAAYFTFEIS
jgi:hypothetical protein